MKKRVFVGGALFALGKSFGVGAENCVFWFCSVKYNCEIKLTIDTEEGLGCNGLRPFQKLFDGFDFLFNSLVDTDAHLIQHRDLSKPEFSVVRLDLYPPLAKLTIPRSIIDFFYGMNTGLWKEWKHVGEEVFLESVKLEPNRRDVRPVDYTVLQHIRGVNVKVMLPDGELTAIFPEDTQLEEVFDALSFGEPLVPVGVFLWDGHNTDEVPLSYWNEITERIKYCVPINKYYENSQIRIFSQDPILALKRVFELREKKLKTHSQVAVQRTTSSDYIKALYARRHSSQSESSSTSAMPGVTTVKQETEDRVPNVKTTAMVNAPGPNGRRKTNSLHSITPNIAVQDSVQQSASIDERIKYPEQKRRSTSGQKMISKEKQKPV